MFARLRRSRLAALALGAAVLLTVALFGRVVLVCHPDVLFPYSIESGNLRLASDQPIPDTSGRDVLERAARKLAVSPLYDPAVRHTVYICNAPWRQWIFLKGQPIAGLNYHPLTTNVFLRAARFYDNRLLSPRGWPIGGGRTLDYYVAHEITHSLVSAHLGNAWGLPRWLNEGYADRIGMGPEFDYETALAAWRDRPPETAQMAEDCHRYDVAVAWLLDVKGRTIQDLLARPPDFDEVNREVGL